MRRLLSALSAVLMAGLVVLSASASAINYGGVGAQPANPQPNNPRTQSIFIYQLKAGQQASDGIKILNNTKQAQVVSIEAVDSELASGGAFTCEQSGASKTDVGSWISLHSNSVTLSPNSSQVVPFTVTVPNSKSIGVGEHDGCITVQAASQTATASTHSGILLSFRTAIRVVVTIPGKIVKQLDIASIQVNRAGNKYQVTTVVNNDGNVSLDASLKLNLISLISTQAGSLKVGTTPILPRSRVSLSYDVKKPFWGGWYREQAVVSYNANPNTELGIKSETGQVTKSLDSSLFFVPPAPLATLIEAVILIAIVTLIYWVLKKRRDSRRVALLWTTYTVRSGDNLQKLAEGRDISWSKIVKVNKLKPPYIIKKGQKLRLPPKNKKKKEKRDQNKGKKK